MLASNITALRAALFANPTAANFAHALDTPGLTAYLNTVDATYFVWRSSTPASDVNDAIVWASLTPADTADSTATFTNRALVCQAKQINLQILLQGRDSVTSSKPNVRNGLQDALTAIPSGAGGATVGGGWAAVKLAMTRTATLAEKMVATGAGTTTAPSTMSYEGTLSEHDVADLVFKDDGTLWG